MLFLDVYGLLAVLLFYMEFHSSTIEGTSRTALCSYGTLLKMSVPNEPVNYVAQFQRAFSV